MDFRPGQAVAVVGAPEGFAVVRSLQAIGQEYAETLRAQYGWLVICVQDRQAVARDIPHAMHYLLPTGKMWICYPKKTGKIPTDLSRDHGWDAIMGIGLRHLNLISIDADWTAWFVELGSNEVSEKTRQKSDARNALLAQWMNHETREMWYPEDMQAVLAAHPQEQAQFLALSFTNRKEYLEWIVSAKRPETRQDRLQKLIPYLREGRKNPAGR